MILSPERVETSDYLIKIWRFPAMHSLWSKDFHVVFDLEKLEWLNGEHIRALTPDAFADAVLEHLRHTGSPLAAQAERVAEVAPIVQEKLRVLSQFEGLTGFLFGPVEIRPDAWERVADDPEAARSLAAAQAERTEVDRGGPARSRRGLRAACEATGLKPRVLFAPVRVAVTGSTVSPGLYESLELLGRDDTLARLEAAQARLPSPR